MRIGLFGGTFDPIHVGHLILAERCREDAALDEVWFLPSYRPPHKSDRQLTPFEQRCKMVTLAIEGQANFRVEAIEKDLPPPSYTAVTLAELRRRHPADTFALIVGADSLIDLPHWYEPVRVIEQAELVAVPRPGVDLWTADRLAAALGIPADKVRMRVAYGPLIEIASRDLRRRIADGRSVRFMVPRAVEDYIRERKLYVG